MRDRLSESFVAVQLRTRILTSGAHYKLAHLRHDDRWGGVSFLRIRKDTQITITGGQDDADTLENPGKDVSLTHLCVAEEYRGLDG